MSKPQKSPTAPPRRRISKLLPHRVVELVKAMLILRDCCAAVRAGQSHMLIPAYGQLRALLIDKATGNKPLLLDLAKILAHQPMLWCGPIVPKGKSAGTTSSNPTISVSGFPVTRARDPSVSQTLCTLEQFLDRPMIRDRNTEFKVRDVINFFANQAGGAHYAIRSDEHMATVIALQQQFPFILESMLLQISQCTFDVGVELLKLRNDLEVHFAMRIRDQQYTDERYIFESVCNAMRISLTLLPDRKLSYSVTGVDGATECVTTDKPLDLSHALHVVIRHQLTEQLGSELAIIINGVVAGGREVARPIFVQNDLRLHETFVNRSALSPALGLEWAMFAYLVQSPLISSTEWDERNAMIKQAFEKATRPGLHWHPGQWATNSPGSMKLESKLQTVDHITVSQAESGRW